MGQKSASAAFIDDLHGYTGIEFEFVLQLFSGSTEERTLFQKLHAALFSYALAVVGTEMQFRIIIAGLSDVVVGIFYRQACHGIEDHFHTWEGLFQLFQEGNDLFFLKILTYDPCIIGSL